MRVGSYLGIPLKINPLFFGMLIVVAALGMLPQTLLLFAILLWHETAHALLAKIYRMDVLEVELLPFGGVARLEGLLQTQPDLEWKIAIVGPLSNLVLIGLIHIGSMYVEIPPSIFSFIIQANIGMAVFNLLPALPLDGGRILRSFLVKKRGFREATDLAALVGQVIAGLLVLLGLAGIYLEEYNAAIFILMGIFVFLSARNEQKIAAFVMMRYLAHKKQEIRLKRVLPVRELVVTTETSVGEVLRTLQPPDYHIIWIMDLDGRLLGFVGELELVNALFAQGIHCKVGTLVEYKI